MFVVQNNSCQSWRRMADLLGRKADCRLLLTTDNDEQGRRIIVIRATYEILESPFVWNMVIRRIS